MRVIAAIALLFAIAMAGLLIGPALVLQETGETQTGAIGTFFQNTAPLLVFLMAILGAGTLVALIAGLWAARR